MRNSIKLAVAAILSLSISGMAAVPAMAAGEVQHPADSQLLQAINAARIDNGLNPVQNWNPLRPAALQHSTYMSQTKDFNHASDEVLIRDLLNAECTQSGAENIQWSEVTNITAQQLVNNYMESPGHRANILNPRWKYVANGTIQNNEGEVYNTMRFAERCGKVNTTIQSSVAKNADGTATLNIALTAPNDGQFKPVTVEFVGADGAPNISNQQVIANLATAAGDASIFTASFKVEQPASGTFTVAYAGGQSDRASSTSLVHVEPIVFDGGWNANETAIIGQDKSFTFSVRPSHNAEVVLQENLGQGWNNLQTIQSGPGYADSLTVALPTKESPTTAQYRLAVDAWNTATQYSAETTVNYVFDSPATPYETAISGWDATPVETNVGDAGPTFSLDINHARARSLILEQFVNGAWETVETLAAPNTLSGTVSLTIPASEKPGSVEYRVVAPATTFATAWTSDALTVTSEKRSTKVDGWTSGTASHYVGEDLAVDITVDAGNSRTAEVQERVGENWITVGSYTLAEGNSTFSHQFAVKDLGDESTYRLYIASDDYFHGYTSDPLVVTTEKRSTVVNGWVGGEHVIYLDEADKKFTLDVQPHNDREYYLQQRIDGEWTDVATFTASTEPREITIPRPAEDTTVSYRLVVPETSTTLGWTSPVADFTAQKRPTEVSGWTTGVQDAKVNEEVTKTIVVSPFDDREVRIEKALPNGDRSVVATYTASPGGFTHTFPTDTDSNSTYYLVTDESQWIKGYESPAYTLNVTKYETRIEGWQAGAQPVKTGQKHTIQVSIPTGEPGQEATLERFVLGAWIPVETFDATTPFTYITPALVQGTEITYRISVPEGPTTYSATTEPLVLKHVKDATSASNSIEGEQNVRVNSALSTTVATNVVPGYAPRTAQLFRYEDGSWVEVDSQPIQNGAATFDLDTSANGNARYKTALVQTVDQVGWESEEFSVSIQKYNVYPMGWMTGDVFVELEQELVLNITALTDGPSINGSNIILQEKVDGAWTDVESFEFVDDRTLITIPGADVAGTKEYRLHFPATSVFDAWTSSEISITADRDSSEVEGWMSGSITLYALQDKTFTVDVQPHDGRQVLLQRRVFESSPLVNMFKVQSQLAAPFAEPEWVTYDMQPASAETQFTLSATELGSFEYRLYIPQTNRTDEYISEPLAVAVTKEPTVISGWDTTTQTLGMFENIEQFPVNVSGGQRFVDLQVFDTDTDSWRTVQTLSPTSEENEYLVEIPNAMSLNGAGQYQFRLYAPETITSAEAVTPVLTVNYTKTESLVEVEVLPPSEVPLGTPFSLAFSIAPNEGVRTGVIQENVNGTGWQVLSAFTTNNDGEAEVTIPARDEYAVVEYRILVDETMTLASATYNLGNVTFGEPVVTPEPPVSGGNGNEEPVTPPVVNPNPGSPSNVVPPVDGTVNNRPQTDTQKDNVTVTRKKNASDREELEQTGASTGLALSGFVLFVGLGLCLLAIRKRVLN